MTTVGERALQVRRPGRWLLVILVAAAVVRLPGVTANLPYLYWHDETTAVTGALRIGVQGLRGIGYGYFHGTLTCLLLFCADAIYYVLGRGFGFFAGVEDFIQRFLRDPTPFILLFRGMMVAASLGVVGMTYAVARKMFDQTTGLIAAACTAGSFGLVQLAFGKEDGLFTCLLLISVWWLLRSRELRAAAPSMMLAGLFFGLAVTVKYLALLAGPIALWVWWRDRPADVFHRMLWWGLGACVGVVIGMPGVLLEPRVVWQDMSLSLFGTHNTSSGLVLLEGLNTSWWTYVGPTLSDNMGVVFVGACMVGMVAFIRARRWDPFGLLLLYPLLLTVALAGKVAIGQGNAVPYFQLSTVPFLLIVSAQWIRDLVGSNRTGLRIVGVIVLGLGLAVNVPRMIRYKRFLSSDDTRTLAKMWVESSVAAGHRLVVEGDLKGHLWAGPQLLEDDATLQIDRQRSEASGGTGRFWVERAKALSSLTPRYRLIKVASIAELNSEALQTGDYLLLSRLAHELPPALPGYTVVKEFIPSPSVGFVYVPMLSRTDLKALDRIALWGGERGIVRGPRISILKRHDDRRMNRGIQ